MKKLVLLLGLVLTLSGSVFASAFTATNYKYTFNFNELKCYELTFDEKATVKYALEESLWLTDDVIVAEEGILTVIITAKNQLMVYANNKKVCDTYHKVYLNELKKLK